MPANLDDQTRGVIVRVTGCTLLVLAGACVHAQRLIFANQSKTLKLQQGQRRSDGIAPIVGDVWHLPLGCLASMALMLAISAFLTNLILVVGKKLLDGPTDDHSATASASEAALPLSSSINFCEDDFQDHPHIAEPANTASSIASYIPLALLGLVGPPSRVWRQTNSHRFGVAYCTLFCIGIGSTLLHAMLTATTQGGDELPMLWFVASSGYIVSDIIMAARQKKLQEQKQAKPSKSTTLSTGSTLGRTLLPWTFGLSAIVATGVYVLARDNFLPFYIMFMAYTWIGLAGQLTVCFGFQWSGQGEAAFLANVLLPLAIWTALSAMMGIFVWVSEMMFCADARAHSLGTVWVPWFFNRVVHVFWHCSSGLLAWLTIQALIAAKGMQDGWGEAQVEWWFAPYVSFHKNPKNS